MDSAPYVGTHAEHIERHLAAAASAATFPPDADGARRDDDEAELELEPEVLEQG
jgi:hypothetical protein